MSIIGAFMITSLEDTKEFINGTRGVVEHIMGVGSRGASGRSASGSCLSTVGIIVGIPPEPFSLRVAVGSNMFEEVVVVAVIQVFTLGWIIPVGFIPTWGLVIGPHMFLAIVNSVTQSLIAVFKANLGW